MNNPRKQNVNGANAKTERQNRNGKQNSADDLSKDSRKHAKRIVDHVEKESLWNLSKCLIGLMFSYYSTKNVKDMLHNWDLGEVEVKSLGSRRFLIFIKDDDLLKILETNHWSLLKEVFVDVEYWSLVIDPAILSPTARSRKKGKEVVGFPFAQQIQAQISGFGYTLVVFNLNCI
ncbi:hypothetical protein V6N13_083446 [Hibiscus sabdariffa]